MYSDREEEVLTAYCSIGDKVMRQVFHCQHPADCICVRRQRHELMNFEYSDKVLDFIRAAVEEKIKREQPMRDHIISVLREPSLPPFGNSYIDAIRTYRAMTGASLKDAKEYVDKLRQEVY